MPIDLRVEHLKNPIGVDRNEPRFTWKLSDVNANLYQKNFRIRVSKDSIDQNTLGPITWDSGEIESGHAFHIATNIQLDAHTKYFWSVEIKDQDLRTGQSEVQSFETGMRDSPWKGSWISDGKDPDHRPASIFRKEFDAAIEIKRAVLYIAAAGLHDATLNGQSISDQILNPIFSQLDKRILYNSYDLSGLINSGQNEIRVLLGNGWYNHQIETVWEFHEAPWRSRPTFIANLLLEYQDGSTKWIVSDETWKVKESDIKFNSIYLGEHWSFDDETQYDEGENDSDKWQYAQLAEAPRVELTSQMLEPVRVKDTLHPIKIERFGNQRTVYHFPRNIAGKTQLTTQSLEDMRISIVHGEQLNKYGHVHFAGMNNRFNSRFSTEQFQTDHIDISLSDTVSFSPLFNYKGFQYVDLQSTIPMDLSKIDLKALVIGSDVKKVGSFHSSSSILNEIYHAVNNSIESNLVGYPTDCPHREKNGWTGDAHVISETSLYTYDLQLFYEKWMMDHRDAQKENGLIPVIIPYPQWSQENDHPDWTSSMIVIPWTVYQFSGDLTILRENFEAMRKYFDFWAYRLVQSVTNISGFGDWKAPSSSSDNWITSAIIFYQNAKIMSETAQLLEESDLHDKYRDIEKKIQAGFVQEALKPGLLNTQTELSMALYYDIVPENKKDSVLHQLVQLLSENNYQLDVGLLGSKTILPALSRNGFGELAMGLASKRNAPSWYGLISSGNTLREGWNLNNPYHYGGSKNHAYLGSINTWMMEGPGGLRLDLSEPGLGHFVVNPVYPTALSEVEVSHESPHGTIKISWQKSIEKLQVSIEVPPNSTSTFHLPKNYELKHIDQSGESLEPFLNSDLSTVQLHSGNYSFHFQKGDHSAPNLNYHNSDGTLQLANGHVVFINGEKRATEGAFQLADITGKIHFKKMTQFDSNWNELFPVSDLPAGQVWIVNLRNTYGDGSQKSFQKKVLIPQ